MVGGLGSLTSLAPILVRQSVPCSLLLTYPDHKVALYLWENFNTGFRIPYMGPQIAMDTDNVNQHESSLKWWRQRRKRNWIQGPFSSPPMEQLHLLPLGVVPKKVPREYHFMYHLSYPWGESVN